MFTKQIIWSTIVATVSMFVLGYLIWGLALVGFAEAHIITDIMKDPPDMPMILLANLIGAFALSHLYKNWSRGNYSAGNGASFGLWIGIFAGLSFNLLWYATGEVMDLTGHLGDSVANIIYYAVIGAIIGSIFKATAPKAASA